VVAARRDESAQVSRGAGRTDDAGLSPFEAAAKNLPSICLRLSRALDLLAGTIAEGMHNAPTDHDAKDGKAPRARLGRVVLR